MLRLSLQGSAQHKWRSITVIILVLIEIVLVTMALAPAQFWTHLLPSSPDASLDGPFPHSVAVVVPVLLYLAPTVIGFLCRNWQQALFYATLPAWLGLGLFVIAASFKVGIFYLVGPDNVTANVSVLELFAALGAIGWLAQYVLFSRQATN